KQAHEDLRYIRAVLARAEPGANPATNYFLWAAITFFGYAILDFAPERAGFYWMIAGPLGGVLSGILGRRAARALGQASQREARAHFLHWTGMMAAILLLIPLSATGGVPATEIPRLILLLVGLAYWLAGVYLDRRMLWLAIAVAGCYLLTVFQRELPYLWTVSAGVLAASLIVCGVVAAMRTDHGEQAP